MARTFWSDQLFSDDVVNGGQFVLTLIPSFSAAEQRLTGITLMRTIIGLDIGYTVHDSGEGSQIVDIGMAIVSQEAFAASVISDPNIANEHPTRGWIFRARGRVFGFAASQPVVFTWRLDRDIRARRKLDNGEAIVIITNNASEGAAGTIRATGLIRTLWLIS